MLISRNWLQQYIPDGLEEVSPDELKKKITLHLAEVEEYIELGQNLENIVVGEIKGIKEHPEADKLSIVTVSIGEDKDKTVICAATNIFEGAIVPIALPGGKVLDPKQKLGEQEVCEIKIMDIKKVKSEGMLASAKELGIGEDHKGILILGKDLKVGSDFLEEISDVVFEIENKSLTHRSDCFSHEGIAREVSAIMKLDFAQKEATEPIVKGKELDLSVKVEAEEYCKRYTAVAIKNVKVKRSPFWLERRLLAAGIRPVNNIVDITNYVMLDIGQPIHAFDYDKLKSPQIIVRTAGSKEKIVTLDEEERELPSEALLICDNKKAIGIAGIMGGKETEIEDDTKNIIIESANFEMYNNRKTSLELGLRTDAGTRFEKGLDPKLAFEGLQKVVQLITEYAEGEVASDIIDYYPKPTQKRKIEFDTAEVKRLIGIDLTKEEIIAILKSLKLKVLEAEKHAANITVEIPTFRRDLHIKEDLLEEVARMYGYQKLKPTIPTKDLKPVKVNSRRAFSRKVKRVLMGLGFDEIYTYSFVSKKLYDNALLDIDKCIRLKNPLSKRLEYLRTDLIPSLLQKVKLNQKNFDSMSFFEIKRTYHKEKQKNGLPKQPWTLSGIISKQEKPADLFYELKGKLTALFEALDIDPGSIRYEKSRDRDYSHPSYQAKIYINEEEVGHIGIAHPRVKSNFDIKYPAAIFSLSFKALQNSETKKKIYKEISPYPQIQRDISFWVEEKVQVADILEAISKEKAEYLKNVDVADIYNKEEKKEKSITITASFRSSKGTLKDKDIKEDLEKVKKSIKKVGGNIRGE